MIEPVFLTVITPLEALLISDNLEEPADYTENIRWKLLNLKLFTVIVENSPQIIAFTKDDLWDIKSIAKSSIAVGQVKVGLLLLTMVARGLQELYAQEASDLTLLTSIEPESNNIKLSEWREVNKIKGDYYNADNDS